MVTPKLIERLRPHAIKASWSVAEQAVSPLLMIALTPFLLRKLGVDQYGLWMLAMTFIGMGQLASLGAGTAVIKHVSADLTTGKKTDAVATIRAALAIVLIVGGCVVLAASITAPWVAKLFFSKMGEGDEVARLIVLGFVLMLVQELDNVFASSLRAAQRFDLSAKVEFMTRIAWGFGVVALTYQYQSAAAVLSGVLVLSIIKSAFKAHQVNRLFAVRNCHIPLLSKFHIRRVADFGKWQWVQSFGGMLFSVADRVIIGSIFGATDLARYSICIQVAQYTHAIPSVAMQVVFPWLSAKIKNGVEIRHLTLYKYAIYAGCLCSLLPAIALLVSPKLLKVWLGDDFYADNINLELLLIFAYGVLAFNVPTHYFLMGMGKIRFLSLTNLLAGTASVLISVILAPLGLEWFSAAKIFFGFFILINVIALKKASQ